MCLNLKLVIAGNSACIFSRKGIYDKMVSTMADVTNTPKFDLMGLTSHEELVYETLLTKGDLTILEISHEINIPRTPINRIAKELFFSR